MNKDYIAKNIHFWLTFVPPPSSYKVLIEEAGSPVIIHPMGIFSIIINQAQNLVPVWLRVSTRNFDLVRSYVPSAQEMTLPRLSVLTKIKFVFIALYKTFLMALTKDVLGFRYDGVKYGDIAYDTYLSKREVATIRRIDIHMARIVYACIRRHERIRRVLQGGNFKAVMVSHQVGIPAGVMLRCALRYGYTGYLRTGHHQSAFLRFEKVEEVYNYPQKSSPEDVEIIIKTLGDDFEAVYDIIFNREVAGKGTKDGLFAFSSSSKFYTDRRSFMDDYSLDPQKKNVFIMLHAFNDFPHSHFRGMVFRDYYDWFIETLKFAKSFDRVNWIFKQHPMIRYYVTRDVSFDEAFKDIPPHIVYIGEDRRIDTRSLIYCADVVITCLGSAGVQLPAWVGIPAIIASDNHYTNLGFALEPKDRKEYFDLLANIGQIGRLNEEQQKTAKAACLNIFQFARASVSACPLLSGEEEQGPDIDQWYWEKVLALYEREEKIIKKEIGSYIRTVAQPGFKRLNCLDQYRELLTPAGLS